MGANPEINLESLEPLLRKYDGRGPRYTSYPPVPYWHDLEAAEVSGWLAEERKGATSLSLYTHIPFCRERCHYCGCFVVITPHKGPADRYLEAVHREMEMTVEQLATPGTVRQYHLGGGTPNFISTTQMAALLGKARALLPFAPDAELSIEVDPRRLQEGELEGLREMGFNRISLGVQDFDETVQEDVNRVEPYEMVGGISRRAKELGFGGVNMDLIYGLPHQNEQSFARTIERVLTLQPDRLAIYNFAYLPQVFPHQRKMTEEALPDAHEKLAMFLRARQMLLENGYLAIGLDHFARETDELAQAWRDGTIRRNFMGYTTQAGTDMLAFGVSAISEYNGRFWQNEKKLVGYERIVESGTLPAVKGMALDAEDRIRKAVISDIFCSGRVDLQGLGSRFGQDLEAHLARELGALEPLADEGLLQRSGKGFQVTDLGQFFLRNIAMHFDRHWAAGGSETAQFSRTL